MENCAEMSYQELIQKYNVQAPRYTSYPTVPFWENESTETKTWFGKVKQIFAETNQNKGISLYIHLPYCESLCTYCGCNKRITKNHSVEETYIAAVLREWQMYLQQFNEKPKIREIHLGGGTPTFFSPQNLRRLVSDILKDSEIFPGHEFSLEGHPNNTRPEHLQVLAELGFNRVSFGVQDFDEKVQKTINRIQPYEKVAEATVAARKAGYSSVNFDLVYGLPFQTLEIINHTINQVGKLMPERIAFYSYAHVPWKAKGQRGYTESDLPDNAAKRALYELGKEKLLALGYEDVGMDHFALPKDELLIAKYENRLHRNFMGYTTSRAQLLLGLGTSSISDAKYAYSQNEKVVEKYVEAINNGQMALTKGHLLHEEDLAIKYFILDLICQGKAVISESIKNTMDSNAREELATMQNEGLLQMHGSQLEVTESGLPFIRNIAMVFDARLHRKKSEQNLFSKSI